MQHRVFGTIEWMAGMGWWTGRVQIDFFSAYDTTVVAACAERLGVAERRATPEMRNQDGEFDLSLIGGDGREPSAGQETAFLHFQKHRDVICNRVVDAIFNLYRSQWGNWRAAAQPGQEQPYSDELLIPELRDRDGLKSVIRLDALFVLDSPTNELGLLGFCFDCSWDPEHGLGVLVHRGKVIEIGENEVTWRASAAAGRRRSLPAPKQQQIDEQYGIAAVKKLGGSVTLDREEPGTPVTEIDLLANNQTNDSDLTALAHFPSLRQLQLASAQITDAGLKVINTRKSLQLLDLSGAAVTDAGLTELRKLKRLKTLYLSRTKITDAGLRELRKLPALAGLHLNETRVTNVGLKQIGKISGLKHVELAGAEVSDAGIRELKDLRALLSLNLERTSVTDAGLVTLQEFKSLRYLDLSRTKVTDKGLEHLKALNSLRSLKLQSTATTKAGVADLTETLTSLQVS